MLREEKGEASIRIDVSRINVSGSQRKLPTGSDISTEF